MDNKKIKIGIVGLGYVGLPLAVEFSRHFDVIGFDKNKNRVKELSKNFDRTLELRDFKLLKNVKITSNPNHIKPCNVFIITVPTPVDSSKKPDFAPLISASQDVGKILKKNDLVIYESTVYPGATEQICVPILEKISELKFNKDFFCGYSPERINPGDKDNTLTSITKLVSGSNIEVLNFVDWLYKKIIKAGTHRVSSIAIAEAAKVIENTQRDVNIALMNELAIIFNKLELDTTEILEAAGTKWNFLPFRPGLVGGHCIGVDPYYLTHKAIEIGYHPEIVLAGRRINDSMGEYIAESMVAKLTKIGINPIGAKIGVFGVTFKENCPDIRNTKVTDIITHLEKFNCSISITDVYAKKQGLQKFCDYKLKDISELKGLDGLIIAVAHDEYKKIDRNVWLKIIKSNGVMMDIKSIFSRQFFKNTSITHWRL